VSAVTLLVPVAYHLQRTSEASSLDPNAPGMHYCFISTFGSMLQTALLTSQHRFAQMCLDAFSIDPLHRFICQTCQQLLIKLHPLNTYRKNNLQENLHVACGIALVCAIYGLDTMALVSGVAGAACENKVY